MSPLGCTFTLAWLLAVWFPVDATVRPDDFLSLSCTTPKACYLLDSAGNLFFSTDKGTTLAQRASHAKLSLQKIRFTGLIHGWGLDQHGNIWRTRNGGRSFESAFVWRHSPVVDIAWAASLAEHIWLAHRDGSIHRLSRNGAVLLETQTPIPLKAMAVADHGIMAALGLDGSLLISTDQGKQWRRSIGIDQDRTHMGDMLTDGKLLLVGEQGSVRLFDPKLDSSIDIGTGLDTKWFDAARFNSGWLLAGQWGSLGYLKASHNERTVFRPLRQGRPDLVGLVALPGQGRCWVAFRNGQLWTSMDGGIRWISLDQPIPQPTLGISFVDSNHGFALVGRGSIHATKNGGQDWKQLGSWADINLTDIFFLDDRKGWAVGHAGCVLRTVDGGETWTLDRLAAGHTLYRVQFVDAERGWTVGEDQVVFRSLDGGRSWSKVYTGRGVLYALHLTSSGQGWVGGEQGALLSTQDGGQSWTSQLVPTSEDLRAVFFMDSLRGLAAGGRGKAFLTKDGGLHWIPVKLATRAEVTSIACFPKTGRCLVGGRHGLLLGGSPFSFHP